MPDRVPILRGGLNGHITIRDPPTTRSRQKSRRIIERDGNSNKREYQGN